MKSVGTIVSTWPSLIKSRLHTFQLFLFWLRPTLILTPPTFTQNVVWPMEKKNKPVLLEILTSKQIVNVSES